MPQKKSKISTCTNKFPQFWSGTPKLSFKRFFGVCKHDKPPWLSSEQRRWFHHVLWPYHSTLHWTSNGNQIIAYSSVPQSIQLNCRLMFTSCLTAEWRHQGGCVWTAASTVFFVCVQEPACRISQRLGRVLPSLSAHWRAEQLVCGFGASEGQ